MNPHLTLEEIIERKLISSRAINICESCSFNTIADIAAYFIEHGSLRHIRNCGMKSQDELFDICKDQIENLVSENSPILKLNRRNTKMSNNDLSMKEIIEGELISVKSSNICEEARLYSLELIIDYYLANASFLRLHSCGPKSNEELILFCKKYASLINKEKKVVDVILKPVDANDTNLSLRYIAEYKLLSTASATICKIAEFNSLDQILEFYENNGRFIDLRNCGLKHEAELISFCEKYKIIKEENKSNSASLN